MPRPARQGPTGLPAAFRTLGPGPTYRELRLVRRALLTGDPGTVDLLEAATCNVEAFHELVAIAEANGSSGFVGLDLTTDLDYVFEGDELGPT